MKLFAFDIDETLKPHGEGGIPQEELDALQALLDHGHAIVLASGRPPCSLMHHLSPLKGEHRYFVSANGADLYDAEGHCLSTSYLTPKDLAHFCKYLKPGLVLYGYEGTKSMLTSEANKWTARECKSNGIKTEDIAFYQPGQPIVGHEKLSKIMFAGEPEIVMPMEFEPKDYQNYAVSRSAPCYLEILKKGSTKGAKVEELRKYLGLSEDDVYCFGDQDNDLSMIERFHGIAMGNAIPSVKKVAEIVTKDVSEHGVSYCLKEILRVI